MKIACHDLVLLIENTPISRDSAGPHFSAGDRTTEGPRLYNFSTLSAKNDQVETLFKETMWIPGCARNTCFPDDPFPSFLFFVSFVVCCVDMV